MSICENCRKKYASSPVVAYHGTRTKLPFKEFDSSLIGSGIVSSNNREYGGFFFTTEEENAKYYTEYFVVKVKVYNVLANPSEQTHPPSVMHKAIENDAIYIIENIVDGHLPSDVIVVPKSKVDNTDIISWKFVGHEETMFDSYDDLFKREEDDVITQEDIKELLEELGMNLKYLLYIPIFEKYYNTKR